MIIEKLLLEPICEKDLFPVMDGLEKRRLQQTYRLRSHHNPHDNYLLNSVVFLIHQYISSLSLGQRAQQISITKYSLQGNSQ